MSSWREAGASDLGFVGGELLADSAALRHRLAVARGRAARWVRRIRLRLIATDVLVVLASIAAATALGLLLEPTAQPFDGSRNETATRSELTGTSACCHERPPSSEVSTCPRWPTAGSIPAT